MVKIYVVDKVVHKKEEGNIEGTMVLLAFEEYLVFDVIITPENCIIYLQFSLFLFSFF